MWDRVDDRSQRSDIRHQTALRDFLLRLQCCMTGSQSPLPQEGGGAESAGGLGRQFFSEKTDLSSGLRPAPFLRKEPALRDAFPPNRHSERQRRISVLFAFEPNDNKYKSAGRLPIGSQGSRECQSGLQRCTPLRHYVALFAPLGSMSLDFQVASLPYKSSSFAT